MARDEARLYTHDVPNNYTHGPFHLTQDRADDRATQAQRYGDVAVIVKDAPPKR